MWGERMHVNIEEIESGFVLTIFGRGGMLPEIKKHIEMLPDVFDEIAGAYQDQIRYGYQKITQENPDDAAN